MEVAALKKIGKGSTLLLMDRNGGQSKAVAKQLKAAGFKRTFVVSNGFNGERLQAAATSLPVGAALRGLRPGAVVLSEVTRNCIRACPLLLGVRWKSVTSAMRQFAGLW